MNLNHSFVLLVAVFSVCSTARASINIKPGLWEVKSTVQSGGRTMDPHAELKKAMAGMSPEQRKMMESRMGSMVRPGGSGFQVCYTPDLLNRDDAFGRQKGGSDCTHETRSKTATRIEMDFKCKDGSAGTSEWTIQDSEHYQGKVSMTQAKGAKSDVQMSGRFLKADCGSVKPLVVPASK